MGRLIDETNLMNLLYALDDARHDLCYAIKKIPELPKVEAIPKADYEARLKADKIAMLKELQYDLYHELCMEIHGKEDCPCVGQTTSCLAIFRVCDADRAIGRTIQQKITELKE